MRFSINNIIGSIKESEDDNISTTKKGDATQMDKINKHMDVSGRGETMVQAKLGLPHKIRVLISKDLGQDELVVGLEDLKDLGILHREFPKTLPEKRKENIKQVIVQYNSIRGDKLSEQMEVNEKSEERARGRGILLYLVETYEQVDEKINKFDSFPEDSR